MRYLLTMSAHNEAKSIGKVIADFSDEGKRLGIELEIQVVDDNSNDNTFSTVDRMGVRIYRLLGERGLASAFRKEMHFALASNADVFIHIDADGQHDANHLETFIHKISEGYDLVLGNRLYTRPINMPEIHFHSNILLSRIVSVLSRRQISDSQTGFRGINRVLAEHIKISSKFTYTQEQIIRCAHQKFKIGEVPIIQKPRNHGVSRLVKNPFNYLKMVFADLEALSVELGLNLSQQSLSESSLM